jgi:SnoaL-like domain
MPDADHDETLESLSKEVKVLASKVADLQAREDIRELFCRYGFAADSGNAREWSEVFARDGTLDGVAGLLTGRAAFARAIEDSEGVHKKEIESKGCLHTTGSVMIRVSGDTAWAEGPTVVWVCEESGSWRPYSLSYNHWDLQRGGGRWEVALRRSRPVSPEAAQDVYKNWLHVSSAVDTKESE